MEHWSEFNDASILKKKISLKFEVGETGAIRYNGKNDILFK